MFLLFLPSKPRVSLGKTVAPPHSPAGETGSKARFQEGRFPPRPKPETKKTHAPGISNGVQRTSEQRPNGRQRIKPETSGFLRRLPGRTFCRWSLSRKFFSMRAISTKAPRLKHFPFWSFGSSTLFIGAPLPSWKKRNPGVKRQKNNGDPAIGTHHPFLAYLHLLYLIE